ncbi:Fic family protein [Lysobacter sp. cf310]|uniref:Fic family protein n=1 Tax=Lysobacter sp. cf310 TaxID=1761790 RepID=UPI0008F18945|nr:Fic family protein [Lysobacter sp. cf310]SFL26863.1 Fic/DOC family protein [Lysobacter sp. cf310]
MRLPFTASREWMGGVFRTAGRYSIHAPTVVPAPLARRAFELLLPICHHEGLSSGEHFRAEVELVMNNSDAGLPRLLASAFPAADRKRFLRGCRRVSREALEFRTGHMLIHSDNALSVDFIPPAPSQVVKLLEELLGQSATGLAGATHSRPGVALATYFALLTLHPLADGNGRSARYYFAACVAALPEAPALLLALALMHSRRSAGFHLVAKLARLGDSEPFLDLFQASVDAVERTFSAELSSLAEGIADEAQAREALIQSLTAVQVRLRAYLFH